MKPTTVPHPRDLASTALTKESTTSSSSSTETPIPTTTTSTTTTEKPFILQINDATIAENELILRWNNGVNMTIPLTKTDDLFCNYQGVMPWDMSSTVKVTNRCNDDLLVVINSEIYGDRMLAIGQDDVLREVDEPRVSKALDEKAALVIDEIYKKNTKSREGRVLSFDDDVPSDGLSETEDLDHNARLVIDEIYSKTSLSEEVEVAPSLYESVPAQIIKAIYMTK